MNVADSRLDQTVEKEKAMIQVGSKEEVAFLLALFGTHTQPIKRPKPKSSREMSSREMSSREHVAGVAQPK
jgi:hypothetical protein